MITNVEIHQAESRLSSGFYQKREIAIVAGSGATLVDAEGKEYIDCASGHGVALIGHAHPRLASAVAVQAKRLITCQEAFSNDQRLKTYEQLLARFPGNHFNRVFFCNSGTEAIEAALKIARLETGRSEIIALKHGFHGRTMGSLSTTWNKSYKQGFGDLIPGVRFVQAGDAEALESNINQETAAVILEIVQGEGGVRPLSPQFLQDVEGLCKSSGVRLIVDEVQTGFGRTGAWFATQHSNIRPDLICVGKGIAGGLPMGAVGIADTTAPLPAGSHGSTFGGNPLCCAAALETIAIIDEEGLVEESARKGQFFAGLLNEINSPVIKEVRGLGLMIGVELRKRSGLYIKAMQNAGVIAIPAGPTVVRFLPPLVISDDQLIQVAATFSSVLEEV
jgi:acetylornithine/LysW-gamma-L-lysine aminotransferase